MALEELGRVGPPFEKPQGSLGSKEEKTQPLEMGLGHLCGCTGSVSSSKQGGPWLSRLW
jgi:hypothetical protein